VLIAMSGDASFMVGKWLVEPELDRIIGDDSSTNLRPHVMDLLVYLARQQGRIAKTEDLLDDLWAGKVVTSSSIYNCVAELRHALCDGNNPHTYIETIPKKGYRLVAPVAGIEGKSRPDLGAQLPDDKIMLVVLPLENLSGDPDQEYFSDGLTAELISRLGRLQHERLGVIARTSAMYYKGKRQRLDEIGRELGVSHVLDGSVQRAGCRLRVTAQLIEIRTVTNLWSETYDRELQDVFAIQDEIAEALVDELKITLLGQKSETRQTDAKAYSLYLQGMHFSDQGTASSIRRAETVLKEALSIDPDFAPAWTELSVAYRSGANELGVRTFREGQMLARDAISKALAIDAQYGPAHAVLASIERSLNRDFTAAAKHVRRAITLSPDDPNVLNAAAALQINLGHLNEGIDLYRQAIALDPVWPALHHRLGMAFYFAQRWPEAADSFEFAQSLSPVRPGTQFYLSMVRLEQGELKAAKTAIEQEDLIQWRLIGGAIVQYATGNAGASDAALQELIKRYAAETGYQIAEIYAYRGEVDHAFDWLQRAYDDHDPGMNLLLRDPLLASLRDDQRWEAMLDKMGLPY